MDATAPPGFKHHVVKTRLKHLISDTATLRLLQDGVARMDRIVFLACAFGKEWYLHRMDEEIIMRGGTFSSDVSNALAAEFNLGDEQILDWMDVVSSDLSNRVGRPYAAERLGRIEEMQQFYETLVMADCMPSAKTPCTNLSYVKNQAAAQIAVNYKTNVHCHFDKYVRQYVKLSLHALLSAEHDGQTLPAPVLAQLKTDISTVTFDILTARAVLRCRAPLHDWVRQHAPLVMPRPRSDAAARASPHWRFEDLKDRPQAWLPYMVAMNRRIEALGGKVLSPHPLRTSFIPSHIRLDSQGLVDLLVHGQEGMELLKAGIEDQPFIGSGSDALKYQLPNLAHVNVKTGQTTLSKGKIFMDLRTNVAPALIPQIDKDPLRAAARFRTAIWRCVTKLGSNKHAALDYRDLVFNNVIDTDGFSVSIHYVSPELYGMTCFNGGFVAIRASQRAQRREEKAAGSEYVTNLSAPDREAILASHGAKLGVDPGKKTLLAVTDGKKTVRYTRAQRDKESGSARRRTEMLRLLRLSVPEQPGVTYLSVQASIGTRPDGLRRTHCSSNIHLFSDYLDARLAVTDTLSKFYSWTVFRRQRYRAYCGRMSSEDRFAHRVAAAFGNDSTLLYGDWGARPNLKHQPPSPGIGLRRRMASHFPVFLTHEPYTSSVCPCCFHRGLIHPRQRKVFSTEPGAEVKMRDIHHLLKCPHPRCAHPWWNRDTLGACNIRTQGLYALEHGDWHPSFRLVH